MPESLLDSPPHSFLTILEFKFNGKHSVWLVCAEQWLTCESPTAKKTDGGKGAVSSVRQGDLSTLALLSVYSGVSELTTVLTACLTCPILCIAPRIPKTKANKVVLCFFAILCYV